MLADVRSRYDQPALTTSARSHHGKRVFTYGDLHQRALQLAAALLRAAAGAEGCSPHHNPARHVVVCGDGTLHAVAALACRSSDMVAVYVPHEAASAETLAKALLVQRASGAGAIVFSEHTWEPLRQHVAGRCVPLNTDGFGRQVHPVSLLPRILW